MGRGLCHCASNACARGCVCANTIKSALACCNSSPLAPANCAYCSSAESGSMSLSRRARSRCARISASPVGSACVSTEAGAAESSKYAVASRGARSVGVSRGATAGATDAVGGSGSLTGAGFVSTTRGPNFANTAATRGCLPTRGSKSARACANKSSLAPTTCSYWSSAEFTSKSFKSFPKSRCA